MNDKNIELEKNENSDILIEVANLKQYFSISTGFLKNVDLKAVDDVSFQIKKGETLGLVGESGCGKTTVGRTLLNLYKPTGGQIFYKGEEIKTKEDIKKFRQKAAMVFQDPYSSLNPRMTVGDIIGEPLDVHKLYNTKEERKERIRELMGLVGLSSEHATRYVHEFSGGQRQRIGIARALAVNPDFIVCDEPVSALDVSIQAQVINMFEDLQKKLGLTYLFIAHDIHVVEHISNRIAVMYLGKIVEIAESSELTSNPLHPYTVSLMSAVPVPDPKTARSKKRIILEGDVPSPLKVPSGCAFRTRCPKATEICSKETPAIREIKVGHFAACHNID
ncbi:MAG: ATP-binding cassette domain-containing protein [Bacilli bacterium]|nr:ATP-binding cassette domain-containing protein [Bacilli bacterium]